MSAINRTNYIHTCNFCRDSGFISATLKRDQTIYAFLCGTCTAAQRRGLSKLIPLWEYKHEKTHDPEFKGSTVTINTSKRVEPVKLEVGEYDLLNDQDCPF